MTAKELFWELAAELHGNDPRVVEGTIMGCKCLRVGPEFLALVEYKGGLVVKLPKDRVTALIGSGSGLPFGPGAKIFKEWLLVPTPNKTLWRTLLEEGIEFVGPL